MTGKQQISSQHTLHIDFVSQSDMIPHPMQPQKPVPSFPAATTELSTAVFQTLPPSRGLGNRNRDESCHHHMFLLILAQDFEFGLNQICGKPRKLWYYIKFCGKELSKNHK